MLRAIYRYRGINGRCSASYGCSQRRFLRLFCTDKSLLCAGIFDIFSGKLQLDWGLFKKSMAVKFNSDLQALIYSDGRVVPLRPQTSDVLRLLVENEGRIISKNEIIEAVWGTLAVTDDSIYQCISEIRQAIGSTDEMRIRTAARRGYAFEQISVQTNSGTSEERLTITDPEPINFINSADGTRIAWTASGSGIPILKAPNWITHLGAERRNKLYGPFFEQLGHTARIVRYDQRGNGMSSWFVPPLSMEAMCADILAVADAAKLDTFHLLGFSQGVAFAIAFAAEYPDRVRSIIGRGGYALGDLAGGNERNRQNYEAGVKLIELGWESEDPTFRRHFTSRIAPDATPEMAREFDNLQRLSVPKENLHDFMDFDAQIDVTREAKSVKCPVLLMHSRGDLMVPFPDGKHLASILPNCNFLPISGDNHTLIPGTAGFTECMEAIGSFLQQVDPAP